MVKYEEALQLIDDYRFKTKTTELDTFDSLGYTLADDYHSQINVPGFRKSAMDGYALSSQCDLAEPFTVIETIYAGSNANPRVNSRECVKIMTGAPIPDDCDFVIVKELANPAANTVTFNIPNTKLNPNICEIGEDIKAGEPLFTTGTLVTATVISSLISCGIRSVEVYAKPRILLVTTGDEVVTNDEQLAYGQIYNSNLAYLKSRLGELGFKTDTTHLSDCNDSIESLFDCEYDLIITTGAISVGDRDIVRNYITTNKPTVIFDRVNIMPGGPVVFWEHHDTPIISLAGSPFANFVTFELFARRILARLTGNERLIATRRQGEFKASYQKTLNKRRFLKASIKNGQVTLPASNHLASSMHEMTVCNCLINLERGEQHLKDGDIVSVIDIRRDYD